MRLVYDNDALKEWAGQLTGPVAVYDNEVPRSGWAEILMLAERLAPQPALLPLEPNERARALSWPTRSAARAAWRGRAACRWCTRACRKPGGFSERVAGYLGKKYGYDAGAGGRSTDRECAQLLGTGRHAARTARRRALLPGRTLSAADVYSATCVAMFMPLPEIHCAMHPDSRAAFEWLDDETRAALDPRAARTSRHDVHPTSGAAAVALI